MTLLKKGDRVFHKNLQEFGTLVEVCSSPCSSVVLFDDGDGLEVTTSLLIQIRNQEHEDTLRRTYDL